MQPAPNIIMPKFILYASLAIFFSGFIPVAYADIIYLKNGRQLEGLIKSEDEKSVELEISFGTVKFEKTQIERISRASSQETESIRQNWEKQKQETQQRMKQQRIEEERQPKKVGFSQDKQNIVVAAKLNKKLEVSLVLDTGAAVVVLSKNTAKGLGMDLERLKPDMKLTLADGRQANAKRIVLENIKVENVETENVEAAIMLDEAAQGGFGDGLLGMSFLKRFNFKVDHKEKKLILEKI